jgi:pyruvate dehydrogenase E2 component (dihydrolipoamide acetyltransferase)
MADVTVPKLGLTVTEVEVVDWLRAVGDSVAEGDPLVVVTADKADVEVTAPAAGTLVELLAAVGDAIDVGGVLARIDDGTSSSGDPVPATVEAPAPSASASASLAQATASAVAERIPGERVFASPLARREAREHGVDLSAVVGSGPGGRIVRADIARATEARATTSPAPAASVPSAAPTRDEGPRVRPMSAVRKVTARRMSASARTTAPASLTVRVDMSHAVLAQQRARSAGVPATLTHLVMLATAKALAGHPGLNGFYVDDEVLGAATVDLAVATDVDGDLYVPVVRDAAPLGLRELVEAARAAVERARSGSLDASDIAGGSFTISNLGMFGVESFTPIINAPQIAILGVGATADELVVVDGQARVRPVLRLSLTFDHRAVDGAPAARFLADLRRHLEAADTLTGLG